MFFTDTQAKKDLTSQYQLQIAMKAHTVSVFDMRPPEKLQLVEDLWDDLAATPEDVPVHEWQKMELARRKSNLLKNPAAVLSWAEVKRNVCSSHVS